MDTHNTNDELTLVTSGDEQGGASTETASSRAPYEAPAVVSMSAASMGSIAGTGCVDAAPGVSCPT